MRQQLSLFQVREGEQKEERVRETFPETNLNEFVSCLATIIAKMFTDDTKNTGEEKRKEAVMYE